MIGKQTKGSGFRGTLNYVLGKDGAEIIGGNMLSQDAKGLAQEFAESRRLKPNLGRAVYHASLSLPPGENLSNSRWGEVADRYMEGMGFKGSQYIAVKHSDTAHSHIHIVASRVRMDGTVVSESHDFRRSEEHIRGLEKEFCLTPTLPSRESPARAPTSGELRQAIREREPSTKLKMQTIINQSAQQSKSMGELFNHLEGKGISVIPNIASTGHVSGISFKLGDEMMKGSDLGRSFTWQGLQKRGISYDHDRDIQRLVQSRERAKSRESGRTGERTAASQSLVNARSSGSVGAAGQIHESSDQRYHQQHNQAPRTQRGDGERDLGSRQIRQSGDRPSGEKHREHSTQAPGGGHGTDSRYFSGSGEHILRMAASVLESGRGSGKMGSVRDQDFTDSRSKKSGFHLEDVAIVKEALKPLDDEKERKHQEEKEERQRIREREQRRRKAREKERGHEIGFSR